MKAVPWPLCCPAWSSPPAPDLPESGGYAHATDQAVDAVPRAFHFAVPEGFPGPRHAPMRARSTTVTGRQYGATEGRRNGAISKCLKWGLERC